MHYKGSFKARLIRVISDALIIRLTRDKLLSNRLKFQRKSLFINTNYKYLLISLPLIRCLNSYKGGFN